MPRLAPDTLQHALEALASFLEADGAERETLVVIGGSALITLGIVSRTTKDVDIMAGVDPERGLVDPRPLSDALRSAADKVARELQLDPHWLNTGPADQVLAGLPEGFLSRLTRHDYGTCLTIYYPDRFDLIHLKLFAIMDQGPGRHVSDLQALKPTEEELLQAARWVLTQDAGEVFPQIVRNTLTALGHGNLADRL
ncbi:MAG: DUF6036 family nucleotidyltransferase [Verrucomicrobiaceae bacterium]